MDWFSILKRIKFSPNLEDRDAAYNPADDTIYLGPRFDFDSALRSIIHEETHAAQLKTGTDEDFRASEAMLRLDEAAKKYEADRQNLQGLINIATEFKDEYLREWLEETLVVEIQAYLSENPSASVGKGPLNSALFRLYSLQETIERGGILITEHTDEDGDYNFIVDEIIDEGTRILVDLEERRMRMSRRR